MKKIDLPNSSVKVDTQSQVDPAWFEKFKALADFVNLFSFDPASLTNGQVLIWNSTTKKFEPGAN